MRYLNIILLGGILCVPAMLPAQERDRTVTERDRTTAQRYYDPYRKDYHVWNENEQRSWERWNRDERHRQMREFARANKREQRDYWRWRHDHPDEH